MDFYRNVSVSSGLPSEYPSDSMLNGTYSASLDDLFPIQNTEGDVSMEWLSAFVEDCLSSTGNCIPAPQPTIKETPKTENPKSPKLFDEKPQRTIPTLQEFTIPGKARSKRRRTPSTATGIRRTTFSPLHHLTTSDPPLLHQAYWLADSELIVSKSSEEEDENEEGMREKRRRKMVVRMGEDNDIRGNDKLGSGSSSSIETSQGQPRRCTHCLSQRTPQWRAGPLGPKTLCNACGVRFKSGRLLPEYRPAKSPTFVSYKHSNSHKKVMEMRMSVSSSSTE